MFIDKSSIASSSLVIWQRYLAGFYSHNIHHKYLIMPLHFFYWFSTHGRGHIMPPVRHVPVIYRQCIFKFLVLLHCPWRRDGIWCHLSYPMWEENESCVWSCWEIWLGELNRKEAAKGKETTEEIKEDWSQGRGYGKGNEIPAPYKQEEKLVDVASWGIFFIFSSWLEWV